ncbi:Hypothetical protein CINCED_3A018558 [Cinara cedri]|uniref:Uncharacterized protein n=1 Tax=Cinara cedri TaxID=506608 RepID=A0A5E4NRP4_9HEMI|nr:Hypothetical protein CINCED_3A018558 [Cinara cedri]
MLSYPLDLSSIGTTFRWLDDLLSYSPVTLDEFKVVVNRLPKGKVTDLDGVPNEMLSTISPGL